MIGIIEYNAGNIASIKNAISNLGYEIKIISSIEDVPSLTKVVFPGQGRAGFANRELEKRGLKEYIKTLKIPFLGICLGMQLLSEETEEDNVKGIGIIPAKTKRFRSSTLNIPQMGWNKVTILDKNSLTQGIRDSEYFYFANSYYVEPSWSYTIGYGVYGVSFSAIEKKDNFYAVQFHPEKSSDAGMRVLKNFCEAC